MGTKRSFRISAFIEEALGTRVYALAKSRGGSVTGILEAALIEYLAARPDGTLLPLGPRLPRPPGRPSRLHEDAEVAREERIRKRTGRPLGRTIHKTNTTAVGSAEAADAA